MNEVALRRPRGRPSWEYDPQIAEEICIEIASKGRGLRHILDGPEAREKGFPGYETAVKWLNSNADFVDMLSRAREFQADFMGDEIIEIIDDPKLEAHDKRVRMDGRKWLMSVLRPQRYGQKIDVTSAGEALAPALPTVAIDARVQTIVMLAQSRRQAEEEARRLLED